mgnify:CR=1 FL=1
MEKKNPLRITETILRDAHQSQAATRMRIEDMLLITEDGCRSLTKSPKELICL